MNTIVNHSKKLLKTVKHLQDAASKSKNNNGMMERTNNIDVNDLCLCNLAIANLVN